MCTQIIIQLIALTACSFILGLTIHDDLIKYFEKHFPMLGYTYNPINRISPDTVKLLEVSKGLIDCITHSDLITRVPSMPKLISLCEGIIKDVEMGK